MEKVAYINVSYQLIIYPQDIGLSNQVDEETFRKVINKFTDSLLAGEITLDEDLPSEIETEIEGFEE